MTFAWKDSGSKNDGLHAAHHDARRLHCGAGLEAADVVEGGRDADRLAAAREAAEVGRLQCHEQHGSKAEEHEDPDVKLECAILVHFKIPHSLTRS